MSDIIDIVDAISVVVEERNRLVAALAQEKRDRRRDLETIARHEEFMREQAHQIEKRDVKLAMSMQAIEDESKDERESIAAWIERAHNLPAPHHGIPADIRAGAHRITRT